jgi:hypothetical protein
MTQLPLKNETEITLGTHQIHYKPKPGTMIFFQLIWNINM